MEDTNADDSESQHSSSHSSSKSMDVDADSDSASDASISNTSTHSSDDTSSSSSESFLDGVFNNIDPDTSNDDLSLQWLSNKIQQDHDMRDAAALHSLHK